VPKKPGAISKKPSKASKELTKSLDVDAFETYSSIRCAGKSLKSKSCSGLTPAWVSPADDMKLRMYVPVLCSLVCLTSSPMLVEEIEYQFFDISFFVCDGSLPPDDDVCLLLCPSFLFLDCVVLVSRVARAEV
jgi:hypothetical protein